MQIKQVSCSESSFLLRVSPSPKMLLMFIRAPTLELTNDFRIMIVGSFISEVRLGFRFRLLNSLKDFN